MITTQTINHLMGDAFIAITNAYDKWRVHREVRKIQKVAAAMRKSRRAILVQVEKLHEAIEKSSSKKQRGAYKALLKKANHHLKYLDKQ